MQVLEGATAVALSACICYLGTFLEAWLGVSPCLNLACHHKMSAPSLQSLVCHVCGHSEAAQSCVAAARDAHTVRHSHCGGACDAGAELAGAARDQCRRHRCNSDECAPLVRLPVVQVLYVQEL